MRFLADENFPGPAVRALEASGHDVVWVRLVAPGAADAQVLARASREARILLTFDKDFGEFILPYEAMRQSADPDDALLKFLQSTYDAAANCGKWDREALETNWV